MAILHRLVGYSSFPYSKSPATDYERRSRDFNWAFKNGRGNGRGSTFAEVVQRIVRDVARCPAFSVPSVLVPIPRSGSSRESFQAGASVWPCRDLALALAEVDDHEVELLLERPTALRRSSDGPERVSVEEHISSLRVRSIVKLMQTPLVLLDDLLVKGTQSMASLIALRRAGYRGPVVAYFVHQAVAPDPSDEQRAPYLQHEITWQEGERWAQRIEVARWRDRRPGPG